MKKIIFIASTLLWLVHCVAYSSIFRTFEVGSGLSHNSVWAVMCDSQGFMWFGTNDGLNRFDGSQFKVYRKTSGKSHSLGNNFVHCLYEDSKHRMFVGTKEGLYLYNRSKDNFDHILLDKANYKSNDLTSIYSIKEDAEGKLWIGTFREGIYVLNKSLLPVAHYYGKRLPSNRVTALAKDQIGNMWIGMAKGLVWINTRNHKMGKVLMPDIAVHSLYCDQNNNLWVGTATNGLFCYNIHDHKLSPVNTISKDGFKPQDIKCIISYSGVELLAGTENGVFQINRFTKEASRFPTDHTYNNLTDYNIFALAKDAEGGLWMGTYYSGVNYWSPYINQFTCHPLGNGVSMEQSITIQDFAEDEQGTVWIATTHYGLASYSPSTGIVKSYPLAGFNDVQALMINGTELWLSIYNKGIYVLSLPSLTVKKKLNSKTGLSSNIVNCMLRTSNNHIYVATSQGADVIDNGKITHLTQLKGYSVTKIIEDYQGSVWFATHMKGLVELRSNHQYKFYTHGSSTSSQLMTNNINSILQDTRCNLWIGTEGEGLAIMNPKNGKVVRKFTEETGMPSNIIYGIFEDAQGNIWVTTGAGLVRLSYKTYKLQKFPYIESLLPMHYSLRSGFFSQTGQCLYFGGTNGFVNFNPATLRKNTVPPKVVITGFFIDGQEKTPESDDSPIDTSIDNVKKLILNSKQTSFGFRFACLSYVSPENNKIAYKLEGMDKDWKYVDSRVNEIQFRQLAAGHYTLLVKGYNSDGTESSSPIKMEIVVKKPFLLSTPMMLLYILLVITAGFYAKKRYKRQFELKNRERMFKFSINKEKELYEQKIKFYTNIAHEIRTPISLISAPLDEIIQSGDGNAKTKRELGVIQRNTKRLLELINQLLDFRKTEEQQTQLHLQKTDIRELISNLITDYNDYARLNKITLRAQLPAQEISCAVDSEAITKIVGNLISNALKYAVKYIDIQLTAKDGQFQLTVTDDGPGIKKEDQEKIFRTFYRVDDSGKRPGSGLGLPLALNLAQLHHGSLTVNSEYGHGSSFILLIPMDLQAEDKPTESAPPSSAQKQAEDESKPTLLIVEDNDELRSFISTSLSNLYNIKEAANGIEALHVLEVSVVNMIISDIMMPEMDGMELCRRVKGDENYSYLPFIVLSAKTDVDSKIDGLSLGADAYLEKPFTVAQLKAQINSIFENRRRFQAKFIQSPLDYFRKPHDEPEVNKKDEEFIKRLNEFILKNLDNEEYTIDSLARDFLISRSSLHTKIKTITGHTPNDYIKVIRLNKAAELLATGKYQVVEVCYKVGFNTPSYFSKCFQEYFHKLPKEFLKEI